MFVALVAIAAAATGPARAQQTYTVTLTGFANPNLNATITDATMPFVISGYEGYDYRPWQVFEDHQATDFTSVAVTSGGEGKVSVSYDDVLFTITITGAFEGTATIHCEGTKPNDDLFDPQPIPVNPQEFYITCVANAAPPQLYTVKMAPGTEDSTSWSFNPAAAATTGVAEGTVVNISYTGNRKVKSVVATVVPNGPTAVTNALGWDGDLAKVTAESTVEFATAIDGMTITGTLGVDKKVSIADGATVTLDGVTINGVCGSSGAGINCVGDATITLSGENTLHLTSGIWPGIYVPQNKTVTIQGEGSLNASANFGAGIGGGYGIACGNITIAGGNITAGGGGAAGIGGGQYASCGNILISGGTVIASGDDYSAAIGGGDSGSCGTITITSGVTSVTATAGGFTSKLGAGFEGSCGTVTIEPGANVTQN